MPYPCLFSSQTPISEGSLSSLMPALLKLHCRFLVHPSDLLHGQILGALPEEIYPRDSSELKETVHPDPVVYVPQHCSRNSMINVKT